jgi:hypothetical protein
MESLVFRVSSRDFSTSTYNCVQDFEIALPTQSYKRLQKYIDHGFYYRRTATFITLSVQISAPLALHCLIIVWV